MERGGARSNKYLVSPSLVQKLPYGFRVEVDYYALVFPTPEGIQLFPPSGDIQDVAISGSSPSPDLGLHCSESVRLLKRLPWPPRPHGSMSEVFSIASGTKQPSR